MLFPTVTWRDDWKFIAAAIITVLAAEIAMTGLPLRPQTAEIVSQNAVAPDAAPTMPAIAAADCNVTLDLTDDPNAMIGITLLAPCKPNADVIIAHAGMVFTAKTMATGAVFLSLPALTETAKVAVKFSTGEGAEASITVPEITALRRFVVQWPDQDGFAIHAYQNGAGFDDPGHIWSDHPATPGQDGYLTVLGDPAVDLPMQAQVYTFPADGKSDVIVEAAVTENTCGFDLMGDAILSAKGVVTPTQITLAMPACDDLGGFVQVPGLADDPQPGAKLARAG